MDPRLFFGLLAALDIGENDCMFIAAENEFYPNGCVIQARIQAGWDLDGLVRPKWSIASEDW